MNNCITCTDIHTQWQIVWFLICVKRKHIQRCTCACTYVCMKHTHVHTKTHTHTQTYKHTHTHSPWNQNSFHSPVSSYTNTTPSHNLAQWGEHLYSPGKEGDNAGDKNNTGVNRGGNGVLHHPVGIDGVVPSVEDGIHHDTEHPEHHETQHHSQPLNPHLCIDKGITRYHSLCHHHHCHHHLQW